MQAFTLRRISRTRRRRLFLDAIKSYPDEVPVYEACIQFYRDTDQPQEVSVILEDAPEAVRSELSAYVSEAPSFSLDDSEVFEDVQQLAPGVGWRGHLLHDGRKRSDYVQPEIYGADPDRGGDDHRLRHLCQSGRDPPACRLSGNIRWNSPSRTRRP